MLRLILLALPIVYMPNALHFPVQTGVPGLNVANLLFVIAAIAAFAGPRRKQPAPSPGIVTMPLIAYFAVLVMGFFVAQIGYPGQWGDDLSWLKDFVFYPSLYFVYRNCHLSRRQTRMLIILVMIVAAIAALEAVREGLDYGYGRFLETRRASGPFGSDYRNANRAGAFFAMFLPMFLAMALFFRERKLWRLASLVGVGLLVLAIMATYSRQAYAIALLSLVLLLLRKHLLLAVLLGCLAVPAINLLPTSVTTRVTETQQKTDRGTEELDVSTASRGKIWSGAMRMWQDHPWGVGLRRFPRNIGHYSPGYAGYDAHNYYVLTLAELGPLGAAALLWLMWRLWRLAGRVRRALAPVDAESRALGIGFTVAVIAMALSNLYGSPFVEGSVMANFWILCGLMEYYALRCAAPTPAAQPSAPVNVPPRARDRFPLAARMSSRPRQLSGKD